MTFLKGAFLILIATFVSFLLATFRENTLPYDIPLFFASIYQLISAALILVIYSIFCAVTENNTVRKVILFISGSFLIFLGLMILNKKEDWFL